MISGKDFLGNHSLPHSWLTSLSNTSPWLMGLLWVWWRGGKQLDNLPSGTCDQHTDEWKNTLEIAVIGNKYCLLRKACHHLSCRGKEDNTDPEKHDVKLECQERIVWRMLSPVNVALLSRRTNNMKQTWLKNTRLYKKINITVKKLNICQFCFIVSLNLVWCSSMINQVIILTVVSCYLVFCSVRNIQACKDFQPVWLFQA